MSRKLPLPSSATLTRRAFTAGAATTLLGLPSIVGAQGGPLKVGVLLPRSGAQASIGQDCQRGVELAPAILKSLGLPDLAIMNADTETNVDVARARAEKLISEGAQLKERGGPVQFEEVAQFRHVSRNRWKPMAYGVDRRA